MLSLSKHDATHRGDPSIDVAGLQLRIAANMAALEHVLAPPPPHTVALRDSKTKSDPL